MKVNEITEGFGSTLWGAFGGPTKQSLAKWNPLTGAKNLAQNLRSTPKPDQYTKATDDSIQRTLAISDQRANGTLDPKQIGIDMNDPNDIKRRAIDWHRRDAGAEPIDWAKIDAAHAAEKAKKSAPASRGFRMHVPKSKTPPPTAVPNPLPPSPAPTSATRWVAGPAPRMAGTAMPAARWCWMA